MPPKGKLAEADVAALIEWVRAGAPWPQSETPSPAVAGSSGPPTSDDPKDFWAFRPVRGPVPRR